MMIKKQLGVLAGAVVAASGANAAITLGGDALAVFNAVGGGSYYQIVNAGTVTGNTLYGTDGTDGVGFSIDISAALTDLGTIDNFALLALRDGGVVTPTFPADWNYAESIYVDTGSGLIAAGSTAPTETNQQLRNKLVNLQAFLDNANLGFNAEGSLGDFDGNANVLGFLNSGLTNLTHSLENPGTVAETDAGLITIVSPSGAQEGVYIDGSTFNATASGPVVPVPAAAWLFGSALVGLGVVRRKK